MAQFTSYNALYATYTIPGGSDSEANKLVEYVRVVPTRVTTQLGGVGTADFDIKTSDISGYFGEKGQHLTFYDENMSFDTFQPFAIIDRSVTSDFSNVAPIKHLSFLISSDIIPVLSGISGNVEEMGSIQCQTAHAVLATMPASITDDHYYPVFNFKNDDGELQGNKAYEFGGPTELENKINAFTLTAASGNYWGEYWTRYDILYFYFRKLNVGGVVMELDEDYIDYDVLEVLKSIGEDPFPDNIRSWDTTRLNLINVLDNIITNETNFRYDFIPVLEDNKLKIKLAIFSVNPLSDDDPRSDIYLSHRLMDWSINKATPYDMVEVIGNPVVIGGTFSYKNGTLGARWDPALESLVLKDDEELNNDQNNNQRVRNKDKYIDVFSMHTLNVSSGITNGLLPIPCDIADDAAEETYSFFGAEIEISDSQPLNYLQEEGKDLNGNSHIFINSEKLLPVDATRLSILKNIPWFKGLSVDNEGNITDGRLDNEKANAELQPIKVFRYDEADDEWHDLFIPPDDTPMPKVNVVQGSPHIWVRYPNHPESLAESAWAASSDPKPSSRPPLSDINSEAGDYSELIVTAAIETNSRFSTWETRTGDEYFVGAQKTLTVYRPFDLWVMKSGSIIEISGDQKTARSLKYDTAIKDEWDKMNKLAKDIAKYAFEISAHVSLTYQGTKLPEWCSLGQKVGKFYNGLMSDSLLDPEIPIDYDETTPWPYTVADVYEVESNSIINNITIDFNKNMITVGTLRSDPTSLFSSTQGSTGAPIGIQVSKLTFPSKGKTQTVHEPQRASAATVPLDVFEIIHGNVIDTGSNKDGVKYISAIPEKLGPEWLDYTFEGVIEDDITLDDGFCIALNIATNSFVWYCHAPPQGVEWLDVWGGQRIYAPRTTSIPIKDGGTEVGSVTVRIPPGIY